MRIGFLGSGNIAAAMARGWASAPEPPERMLFTDSGSGRAAALAAETGGETVASNAELAGEADLLILAVKPSGLDEVAAEASAAPAVLSLLGATSLERVARAFPDRPAFRVMPNLAVEVHRGVLCFAAAAGVPEETEATVRAALAELGRVVDLPDSQFDAATALMGCSPAYFALVIEAIADAGAAEGLDVELARSLVVDAAAGTAELLRAHDPVALRDAVASPGGSTEAGLEALREQGAAEAFAAAVRASLARMRS